MARLNERHAAVLLGTQTIILDEGPNEPGQPPMFMKMADFHLGIPTTGSRFRTRSGRKRKI